MGVGVMIHGLAGVKDLSITSGNSMVNIPCMTAHLDSFIIQAFACSLYHMV